MARNIDISKLDLKESIVNIRRVTKVVKGGKNSRFSVTVVVGDSNGHVGLGLGKSVEIPEAVRKATEDAKKSLITVPMVGTTIPHRSLGVFGAGKVLLMPAVPGTGVIAGGAARSIIELAGIKGLFICPAGQLLRIFSYRGMGKTIYRYGKPADDSSFYQRLSGRH